MHPDHDRTRAAAPSSGGVSGSYSEIYETYHGRVRAWVAKLIGREEADDVTQEVFVKVARSLNELHDLSKLSSWIYAIAANTVRDTARKRSRGPRLVFEDGASVAPAGQGVVSLADTPDLRSRSPEEQTERHEMVACYLSYVEQLPPRYYEVYALSELEELSNEEIARRLSLSPGTVKIRLHRARAQLIEKLRCHCQPYYNERGELMGKPRGLP